MIGDLLGPCLVIEQDVPSSPIVCVPWGRVIRWMLLLLIGH